MNSDRPARRFGLLQRLLADGRALLRTTARAFDDLMSDNEMASRLTMRHESDDLDTSWKSRSSRGVIVRSSGQYWHRFTEHYKDNPTDFVVAQTRQGKASSKQIYQRNLARFERELHQERQEKKLLAEEFNSLKKEN